VLVWGGAPLAPTLREGFETLDWVLFVCGTLFFILVLVGLVWLCAWLVREMRVNQSQRAFLDAVTHELKTPLASFRLYLDTLDRHALEPERRDTFLMRMREDLDRLEGTINQVLAAARAEERTRKQRRQAVDLAQLLRQCVTEACERHQVPDEAVRLWGLEGRVVQGNRDELELVFRNLLDNAIKYSDEPVDVRIEVAETPDGRVRVEISDRGIGIPEGELGKIFQRFYRARRDVRRRASGLGLGLFIVGHLVRRQGGRIVALSEGAGRGSRFVLTLRAPRVAATALRPVARSRAPATDTAAV